MNILFITQNIDPFNPTTGSMQRSSLLLQVCAQVGNVDLLAFGGFTDVRNDFGINVILHEDKRCETIGTRAHKMRQLLTAWNPEKCYPINSYIADIINQQVLTKEYDYIVVRYMPNAVQYGLYKHANKLILDIDDSPVDKALMESEQAKTLRNKLYYRLYALALRHSLWKFIQHSNHCFFSNANQVKGQRSVFLPNIPYYNIQPCDSNRQIEGRILFVGYLGYPPNFLGVDHFIEKIYPRILERNPNTTFHIAGKIWDENYIEKWNKIQGVSILGFVPDIKKEYEEAQLVVIPIYSGVGTCIKVLESMQMGRVCITTKIGARGYECIFASGEDYIVVDNDELFAESVNKLFKNSTLEYEIIQHAQKTLSLHYSRDIFFNVVKASLV